jgi:hypothetical protein
LRPVSLEPIWHGPVGVQLLHHGGNFARVVGETIRLTDDAPGRTGSLPADRWPERDYG